jgi:hypothetical protein
VGTEQQAKGQRNPTHSTPGVFVEVMTEIEDEWNTCQRNTFADRIPVVEIKPQNIGQHKSRKRCHGCGKAINEP